MKINLLNITSIDFDLKYIPHFCKYYLQFDINEWYIILQTNSNNSFIDSIKLFKSYIPKVKLYIWNQEFDTRNKIKKFNNIIKGLDGYVMLADIDEYHQYIIPPHSCLTGNITWGIMIDRFKQGRTYGNIKNEGATLFEQFPVESNFSRKNLYTHYHKPCLFPSKYKLIGSHDLLDKDTKIIPILENGIKIAHFKWTDTTKDKLIKRIETYYPNNMHWQESVKALNQIYNYKHPLLEELERKQT